MYITRCASFARIIPRRRIKLGGRMVCSVAHEAKGGREKKTTIRNGIASQPLATIYLALNSWSELWVTLSTTCSALRVKEGPFWFLTGKVTIVVAVLTSRRPHSSLGSVSLHQRCDSEKGQQKTNSLWKASSRKRKKKKKNERKKDI